MDNTKFSLLSFTGKMKTLHLSWWFFITLLSWFNPAPTTANGENLAWPFNWGIKNTPYSQRCIDHSGACRHWYVKSDRYGPRLAPLSPLHLFNPLFYVCYGRLSFKRHCSLPIRLHRQASLSVFALCLEWFCHNELGTAEGIYGGWGYFGSAAAAFTLPTLALAFGGEDGWRYAVGITGLASLAFSFIFLQKM